MFAHFKISKKRCMDLTCAFEFLLGHDYQGMIEKGR